MKTEFKNRKKMSFANACPYFFYYYSVKADIKPT